MSRSTITDYMAGLVGRVKEYVPDPDPDPDREFSEPSTEELDVSDYLDGNSDGAYGLARELARSASQGKDLDRALGPVWYSGEGDFGMAVRGEGVIEYNTEVVSEQYLKESIINTAEGKVDTWGQIKQELEQE